MKNSMACAALAVVLAACAATPEQVAPTYVSPTRYSDMSCAEIDRERSLVSERIAQSTSDQRTKNAADAAFMAGLVLFPPLVFAGMVRDQSSTLADRKGQALALEDAWKARKCTEQMMAPEAPAEAAAS